MLYVSISIKPFYESFYPNTHKWPSISCPWQWALECVLLLVHNYINPGSQIPQVEAGERCSRDLFTSSGRATALIDRHFWYTFLQQSMTRLTNTAILLTYTSRFHWRFSGNLQEHICEHNIRCFGSPGHLSLGSDRLIKCDSVPNLHCTAGSRKLRLLENILKWLALCSSRSPHLYSTVVFGITFWGEEGRMTVWLEKTSANGRESAHNISLMAALLHSTRSQRCLITITLRCQRVPRPRHGYVITPIIKYEVQSLIHY